MHHLSNITFIHSNWVVSVRESSRYCQQKQQLGRKGSERHLYLSLLHAFIFLQCSRPYCHLKRPVTCSSACKNPCITSIFAFHRSQWSSAIAQQLPTGCTINAWLALLLTRKAMILSLSHSSSWIIKCRWCRNSWWSTDETKKEQLIKWLSESFHKLSVSVD